MGSSRIELTAAQRDRAVGVLLGAAAGDALGAGYELNRPLAPDHPVGMIGGGLGPFAPGEWTDDTSMAIAIAEIASTGEDLRKEKPLDYLVERWEWWSRTAPDVGVQTRTVLSETAARGLCAQTARAVSEELHRSSGRTAGNGSLMRTSPVALAYLDDEAALVQAARTISELTHFDPNAGDACVLWCTAIRHTVLTGEIDVRVGLSHIVSERRRLWEARLAEAEASPPSAFCDNNGWVVAALQAAWSAISTTPVPHEDPRSEVFRADHLGWRWRRRCAAVVTPIRWRPSPAACSARRTARQRCRHSGDGCCTGGRGCEPEDSPRWPTGPSTRAAGGIQSKLRGGTRNT